MNITLVSKPAAVCMHSFPGWVPTWRTSENDPIIIIRYPPYLVHWYWIPIMLQSQLLCIFYHRHGQTVSFKSKLLQLTVMILSFRTDMPGQTVQTQIRLLLIRVYTVCHSVCIVWTHYSMVEPHSSNFRLITTNFLGVRIFRNFTVSLIPGPFCQIYI